MTAAGSKPRPTSTAKAPAALMALWRPGMRELAE